MELKQINEIFSNLQNPKLPFVEQIDIETNILADSEEGEQEEENTYDKIYKMEDGVFLVVHYYTDSYGNGEYMRGAELAKAETKEINIYKPIN